MSTHVFVAMPFGTKEGIDFNKVYDEYIKPALESEGFDVFRADEESRAGNIRTDMFQELLLADLVVVDLSIDNPNVWYELGVRHALRARGVIQIQSRREYMPFDVYTDRTLSYHIKNGTSDPEYLENDKKALASFASETLSSWHGRKMSPVYHLLPNLKEPDWKSLRIGEVKEFWEAYEAWESRMELARREDRLGDILVLAEEGPTRIFRFEAYRTSGSALRTLGQFSVALEQYEKALTIEPNDLESRQQKGILLGRLKKYDEAKLWLNKVVEDHPDDAESWGLLGRVEKDAWVNSWRQEGKTKEKMRDDAAYEDALLNEAIEAYSKGFQQDPGNYYPGINAVSLMHLLQHLTEEDGKTQDREDMEGGIRWATRRALNKDPKDYWARVTLGDLEVLLSDKKVVERAYKDAVAVAEKDWFKLDSSQQQLLILQDLEFRPEVVKAALNIFDREMRKLTPPEKQWKPHRVFLFSGHMIDAPGRYEPRFPANKETIASEAFTAKLDELKVGPDDLALCGGACGGDLLFAEACLQRDLRLEIRIPFKEPEFLQKSVAFAGDRWRDRFYQVKNHAYTKLFIMPDELGPLPKDVNPYVRNNLWQLYTALAWGIEKVHFICLWNRKGGDGIGGTEHMHNTVLKYSGQVHVLDTNILW